MDYITYFDRCALRYKFSDVIYDIISVLAIIFFLSALGIKNLQLEYGAIFDLFERKKSRYAYIKKSQELIKQYYASNGYIYIHRSV